MAPIPKTIGRYDIIELVGRGGMGVLYRARDAALERDVALKMMIVDFSVDPAAHDRFLREAKAVARLQHRNVVTIHELGEHDGAPYIVMEFLSGKDLEHLLDGAKKLTLVEKLDIAIQICEGLGYAHEQGIVHRDIKPGNVRVLEDGTVKILDFGIAKFAKSSATQSGTILGTASYMAPEQIMGQQVDGRADLFSTGVLLHELLSGQKPFQSDTPTAVVYQIMHVEPPSIRSLVPELPEAMDDIVARALAKNPDERYSRASEMASDLQMVKLMLDLPLQGSDAAPAEGTPAALAKPFATSIRPKTGGAAGGAANVTARNIPIRATAAAKAADQAARPVETKANNMPMILGGVGAVLVFALVGYFLLKGKGDTPSGTADPTNTSAAAPGNTNTTGKAGTNGASKGGAANTGGATSDTLTINSTPPGAKITLNGVDTGKVTPAQISLAGKQSGVVDLSLKGYQTLTGGNITANDLKTGSKDFRLAREAGAMKLTISGQFAFELVQGGKVISPAAADHDLTIQPSGGPVTARNTEYLLSMPLALDFSKSSAEVTIPRPGFLSVYGGDTCTIFVDGQDLGGPPLPKKPVAAQQKHMVTLKCPGAKDETQTVTVASGEDKKVTPRGGGDH